MTLARKDPPIFRERKRKLRDTLTQYGVYVMENGDKFFARFTAVVNQSSSGQPNATGVGHITGGTGKFAAIQGFVRQVANFDSKTGFNETQTDIEYSIDQ